MNPTLSARRFLIALAGITTALLAGGCGDPAPAAGTNGQLTPPAWCGAPEDGCPCTDRGVGTVVDCGHTDRVAGDYVTCMMGRRTCLPNGYWGACEGETEVRKKNVSLVPKTLQAAPGACPDPCNPNCQAYTDDPTGIAVGAGLEVTPAGGLTLTATGVIALATVCSSLEITPANPTITLTSIAPIAPATLDFTATLSPPGCYPFAINPLWAVEEAQRDRAYITSLGNGQARLTVASPVAGPVQVKALIGGLIGTTTAQVNVDVVDVAAAPGGYTAASFTGAAPPADVFNVLYPYPQTVIPLSLLPVIPQWESATAANAVKVTLRHASGPTSFSWAAVIPEDNALTIVPNVAPAVSLPAGKRYPNIPAVAWSAFERTARGKDAAVVIQRITGGTLKAEKSTTIHFAHGQLKGTAFYQSYGTQLAPNFSGGAQDSTVPKRVFPGGVFGAATLAIRPGVPQPTVVAGGGGCRVCHSASADGNLLITQVYPGNAVSERYTNLAATPAVAAMSPGDMRFSWPALFPTGGTASGFLFSNAHSSNDYTASEFPGGLDGANTALFSSLYSTATGTLGNTITANYVSGGGSPLTIPVANSGSPNWTLKAALPVFSPAGDKVAFQHHTGRVCATGTATNCTADERKNGDKRSIAIMDFDTGVSPKRFSNFKVLVSEPNTPCNTTYHPTQPCVDVWPTFMPGSVGVVFEKELVHNGYVGGGLSDFGGTRSGCDSNNAICNNEGTKGELWWVNTAGAPTPVRLNRANGRDSLGVSTLPAGSVTAPWCRVGGFACAANGDCCSNTCSAGRCRGSAPRRFAGDDCTAANQCESNFCLASKCGCSRDADCGGGGTCTLATGQCSTAGSYYVPPAPTYSSAPAAGIVHTTALEPALNYEPSMNPVPTYDANGNPEFYWVIFTSRRMFGNIATVNPWWSDPRRRDISQTVTPKKLWVAAISANPTPGTDPSFPAFYLPGQEWVAGNSRGYWVQDACTPGNAARPPAARCDSNQDCCAGSECSLDVSNIPTKHCVPIVACVNVGAACTLDSDCCNAFCQGGQCTDPPPIPIYGNAVTYDRDYAASCAVGSVPVWRLFEYQADLPLGTSIAFTARTAASVAALPAAAPVVTIGTAVPPSTTGWTGFSNNIDQLLRVAGGRSSSFLRVSMTLTPSVDFVNRPTLTDWRVTYDCNPAE